MTLTQPSFATSKQSSKPVGRRERHRAEIRERLFRAALQVFGEKGFSQTTCEDITNAADVGKGTFFNYFPSKEHIVLAFSEMQLGKLRAFVEEARGMLEPAHLVQRLSERMSVEPGRSPAITRVLLRANLATEPVRSAMYAYEQEGLSLLSQVVEIGQQRGEIRRDRPPAEIASFLRQLYFGTMLLWTLHPDVPLKDRLSSSFGLLWSGIAAPAALSEGLYADRKGE